MQVMLKTYAKVGFGPNRLLVMEYTNDVSFISSFIFAIVLNSAFNDTLSTFILTVVMIENINPLLFRSSSEVASCQAITCLNP